MAVIDVRLLIDGIARQTSVLIPQLSTAAGVRAPLSHVADQVFLELSREVEAQGVRRQVVADMFAMALRSYQTKVQRLTKSASVLLFGNAIFGLGDASPSAPSAWASSCPPHSSAVWPPRSTRLVHLQIHSIRRLSI